mmetsp:Transcript_7058/g.14816  ORF Transcript_7058/g.14816 Transcript_7058/m.14816 type:complete len:202 (-) Transcript_7058:319-924(-)
MAGLFSKCMRLLPLTAQSSSPSRHHKRYRASPQQTQHGHTRLGSRNSALADCGGSEGSKSYAISAVPSAHSMHAHAPHVSGCASSPMSTAVSPLALEVPEVRDSAIRSLDAEYTRASSSTVLAVLCSAPRTSGSAPAGISLRCLTPRGFRVAWGELVGLCCGRETAISSHGGGGGSRAKSSSIAKRPPTERKSLAGDATRS